jgi:hypothetical protein
MAHLNLCFLPFEACPKTASCAPEFDPNCLIFKQGQFGARNRTRIGRYALPATRVFIAPNCPNCVSGFSGHQPKNHTRIGPATL